LYIYFLLIFPGYTNLYKYVSIVLYIFIVNREIQAIEKNSTILRFAAQRIIELDVENNLEIKSHDQGSKAALKHCLKG